MHSITVKNENRIYSQNGEDGIIDHIFATIGVTNRVAVEIGVSVTATDQQGNYISNRMENNTASLADDWKLYWFDIIDPFTTPGSCTFTNKFLTKDNIVASFEQIGIPKEFDLLSIDIDSNDYYLRDALKGYSPRVVISEYNGCFDGSTEYIMPYNEDYIWPGSTDREYGASLKSLTKQADELGYDLVYCEKKGVNAFFIRKDVNVFKTLTSEEAWVGVWWSYRTRNKTSLNNVFSGVLQRLPTNDEYEVYKDIDIGHVKDILVNTTEYITLNLEKSSVVSPQITFPYTIMAINDRASDNRERIKNIMPTKLIDDIQFINGNTTDMLAFFDMNGVRITWDESFWNRRPLGGELGCVASHLNCLKYMIENDIPEMLVLEDDAILVENFLNILNNCYNDLPKDYDFLTNIEELVIGDHCINTTEPILIGSQFISKSHLVNSITKFMLYSYNGAKKIIEEYKVHGVYTPVDMFLFDMGRDGRLNGYSTFISNQLIQPANNYGSLIDPADLRLNCANMEDLPWVQQDREKFRDLLILYESILGRPADRLGVHHYMTSGLTLREIKNALISSKEYEERRARH